MRLTKRLTALALAFLLILGPIPIPGFAAKADDPPEPSAAESVSGKIGAASPEAAPAVDPENTAPEETVSASEPKEPEHGLGGRPEDGPVNTWVSDAAAAAGPSRGNLPARYNAADYGIITPVRDQGSYGTCWAHAAIACVETYMVKYGIRNAETNQPATTDINLSEYHLAWFTYADGYDKLGLLAGDRTVPKPIAAAGEDSYLDMGGTFSSAMLTLMRGEGPASEHVSGLGYGSASASGLSSKYAWQYNAAQVVGTEEIPTKNRNAVKEKIILYGAGLFEFYYNKKYLNSKNGAYCCIQTASVYDEAYNACNHAVTVVGWDDNYDRTNFPKDHRPTSNGAWICKNSWGRKWGDGGYMYISYEDTASGHAYVGFFRAVPAGTYDDIYQYDGTICPDHFVSITPELGAAAIYTMQNYELLQAAAIRTDSEGTDYTLSVYLDPTDPMDPTSGRYVAGSSGTFTYAGYHRALFDPVLVRPGQKVAVVFDLYCPIRSGDVYGSVGIDKDDVEKHYDTFHETRTGCSLVKADGDEEWCEYDFDVRIKLFANEVDAANLRGTWYASEQTMSNIKLPGLFLNGETLRDVRIIEGALPQGMNYVAGESSLRLKGIPSGAGNYHAALSIRMTDGTCVVYDVDIVVQPAPDPSLSTEVLLLPYLQEVDRKLCADWGDNGCGGYEMLYGSTAPGIDVVIPEGEAPRAQGVPYKKGTYRAEIRFLGQNSARLIDDRLIFTVYDPSKPVEMQKIDLSRGSCWMSAADYSSHFRQTLSLLHQDNKLNYSISSGGGLYLDLDMDGEYDVYGSRWSDAYRFEMNPKRTVQRDWFLTLSDEMLATLGGRTDYIKELWFEIEPRMIPSYTLDLSDGAQHRYPIDEYTEHLLWPLALLARDGMIRIVSDADDVKHVDLDMDGTEDLVFSYGEDYAYFRAVDTNSVQYWQKSLTEAQQQELSSTNSAITVRVLLPRPVVRYDLWIDEVQVTEKNRDDILGNGVFEYNGLTLEIHGDYTSQHDLVTSRIPGLLIYVSEDSRMVCGGYGMGLDLMADATIWGPGKLTLEGYLVALYLDAQDVCVQIYYTELEASGEWGVAGENKNERLEVDNASVIADGPSGAICEITNIVLSRARVVEPKGGYVLDGDVVDKNGVPATHAAIYSDRKYNPFEDVKEGAYYYDAVLWAANRIPQVTNGVDDTHFGPGKKCTRGQVVTFLWRANDLPAPETMTCGFTDVKPGAYYYDAMLWAVENGITSGKDETHFGPNLNCTRGEVVTFLWRAAGSPEPISTVCPFTDVKPGAYYYKAMLWALEKHITTGSSETTFNPGGTCTRGQVVTFLYRAYGPKG